MKKVLRIIGLSLVMFCLNIQNIFARGGGIFGDGFQEIQDEVESVFPIVVGIVFIICALTNIGNFFGENRDIKKGVMNIVTYVGATLVFIGVYSYLTSVSL